MILKHSTSAPLFKFPKIIIYIWLLLLQNLSLAMEDREWIVSTLTEARANGDIFIADDGDIYISDFGPPNLGNGSTVVKITPEGEVSTFATGLTAAPSGVTMDAAGNLLVATLNGGDIYSIAPNGNKSKIITGLRGPVGLTMDNNNNLYLAECSINRISKVSNGTTQTVANIPGITCANGLVWGHDNALYVLMWQNGDIYRVDLAGNVSLFATIPGGGGHLEYLDGYYYVLARTAHRIYKVDHDGNVVLFAGTGVDGNDDGPAAEATFSRPNGIGVNRNTHEFYVTGSSIFDTNPVPIRKISMQSNENGNDFIINHGLSGSWFDPITSGQGLVFDFAFTADRFDMVMYWFTYDDMEPDSATELNGFGSTQSRWFTALGPVEGAKVNMPIYRSAHGIFDHDNPVVSDVVGNAEVEFFSCFEAILRYQFTVSEEKSGEVPLQRITPDIMCESLNN